MNRLSRACALLACAAVLAGARAEPRLRATTTRAPGGTVVHLLLKPAQKDGIYNQALSRGVLTLRQGCIEIEGRPGPLIWPDDTRLDLSKRGVVRLVSRRTGKAVQVGQGVALGGGSGEGMRAPPGLTPDQQRCFVGDQGWSVGQFEAWASFSARYPHLDGPPRAQPKPPGR